MPVLVSTRSGNVSVTINIGHDFLNVLFLHILATNSERITLSAVLVVRAVLTHHLAQRARERGSKVVLAVGGPVVDISATDACVSESL